MDDRERPSERRQRHRRNVGFWQRVGMGVVGASLATGSVAYVNKEMGRTNKDEATEIEGHVLELNNTVANADRSVDSRAELERLQAKLGDKVILGVRPKFEHTGVIQSGDGFVVDEKSPTKEIKWGEVKDTKFVLLGSVHYEGPMSVAELSAVGPDGKEFYKGVDTPGSAVDMENPVLEATTEGLIFYGTSGESSRTTRVTISYDGLLRTVTHSGFGPDNIQANRYNLSVNGQYLSESRNQTDPSKKGESVVAELETKADEYIMRVVATNEVASSGIGLGIDSERPAIGETDRIVRSHEVVIGELEAGDSVTLNSPRSITFVG